MEKAYETYIHTGVEWIGRIPESWILTKLKFLLGEDAFRSGPFGSSLITSKLNDYGNVLVYTPEHIAGKNVTNELYLPEEREEEMSKYLIAERDIVLPIVGTLGNAKLFTEFDEKGILNQRLCRISPNENKIEGEYLLLLLKYAQFIKEQLNLEKKGAILDHITKNVIFNFDIPLPSIKEQTQIEAYLDYHTQLIDTLISKKETLIQKLQEQRQAIINEAVTKGLNKNVALKDSGIEWLGDIPAHWEITSIKNILDIPITDGPHTTPKLYDEGIPFISAESIRNNEIDFNRKRGYISEEDYELFSKKYLPRINDIYMVKSGATTGNIGIVKTEEKFTIWSPLAVFRAKSEKVFYEYLFYYLQSSLFKYQVELNWSYGTQQNIGMGVLSNLKISYPSVVEQQNIVSFIKNSALKIVINIEKIQTSIQKLKEYRQSLISEAVTGKIDVRDWQHPNS